MKRGQESWPGIWAIAVAASLLAVLPLAVSAQSLKERKAQQGEEAALASEVDYTNQVCGSNIRASVDWNTYSAEERPSGSCDAALGAIESVCDDAQGQQAVQQNVDKVVCRSGSGRDVQLKGGTLTVGTGRSVGEDFRYIRNFLSDTFGDDEE